MLTLTIDQYLDKRSEWIANPQGRLLQTPRGECIVTPQFIVHDTIRPNWHLKRKELEDAEFRLVFYSEDMPKQWRDKLYANDDKLYEAYKSLNVVSLGTNGKRRESRKNIVFNKECCLGFWQLHCDTLIVISRSLDLQRAGLSDMVIVNRIARLLNCNFFEFISLCPHVYADKNNIARRKECE